LVIHCAVCQTVFPPGLARCPACKSDDIMIGVETPGGTRVSAARGGTVRLRGWGEPAYKDGGQFLRHHVKLEWSPQRKRYEYVERIFNKLEGTYTERYHDPDTGEIVFQKHGPITDQSLHGRRAKGA
jgi:hypothetical protein